jgi:hypothetical protein
MNAFRCFAVVPGVVLLSANVAFAQPPAAQAPPLQRGYMTAVAGASFAEQQTPTFGVEYGEHINPSVQAYANFSYFDNLITDSAQDDLTELAADLTRLTATPWHFTGYERGLGFSGGAKYVFNPASSVRPYVGGGPGVLNLRRTIVETDLGDITNQVITVFGAPDGYIDPYKETTFRPMAEFLAGVGISAGRTYVDVGYRLNKVFKTPESFSFSQFRVGVGMRF